MEVTTMSERMKFQFPAPDRDGVEEDISLGIFTAECIYGRPRTRLDVAYFLTGDGRRAVIDVKGPAGETALRVIVGLLAARFGEDGYQVERVEGREPGRNDDAR
jgi:hypothetical protein